MPGGKLNRGMAVYDVLASIQGAEVSQCRDTVVMRAAAHDVRNPAQCNPCIHSSDKIIAPANWLKPACWVQDLSEEDIFKANALGWCIEWVRIKHASAMCFIVVNNTHAPS